VVNAVVSYRQTADDHVRVADRLNLIDVVVLNDGVKQRVQVVQQLHDLTAQRHQAMDSTLTRASVEFAEKTLRLLPLLGNTFSTFLNPKTRLLTFFEVSCQKT